MFDINKQTKLGQWVIFSTSQWDKCTILSFCVNVMQWKPQVLTNISMKESNQENFLKVSSKHLYLFYCFPSRYKQNQNSWGTMLPNWKLFPLGKLHEVEPFKSYMQATTTGRQIWIKGFTVSGLVICLIKFKWP